jgi:hypothetical protein
VTTASDGKAGRLTKSPARFDAVVMKRLALGVVALVAGCGGSAISGGDGGSNFIGCGIVPCGGDIVGRWRFLSYCGASTYQEFGNGCPEGTTFDRAGVTTTGMTEYTSGWLYTESMTMSGTILITAPASCVASPGSASPCDWSDGAYRIRGSGSCVVTDSGGCACAVQMVDQTRVTTGGYSFDGRVLVMQPATGGPENRLDYCVQGAHLTVFSGAAGVVSAKLP